MSLAPEADHDRHQQPVKLERAPDLHPLAGEQRQAAVEGDYQRERDDEQPAGQWSDDLGEFIKPTSKASSKPAAIALVHSALEAIRRHGGKPGVKITPKWILK